MTVQMSRKLAIKLVAKRARRKSKVTGNGLAMDVYSGGKRLPAGKSIFDLKRRKTA